MGYQMSDKITVLEIANEKNPVRKAVLVQLKFNGIKAYELRNRIVREYDADFWEDDINFEKFWLLLERIVDERSE